VLDRLLVSGHGARVIAMLFQRPADGDLDVGRLSIIDARRRIVGIGQSISKTL
jgi:hypothetical protein